MHLSLQIQNIIQSRHLPTRHQLLDWITHSLFIAQKKPEIILSEITLRIVSSIEMTKLNSDFRKQNKVTNVLSFPFEPPKIIFKKPSNLLNNIEEKTQLLGDIVICEERLIQEAKMQNKTCLNHWAHLIIHSTLHLIGFDHILEKEAVIMENLEINILSFFNIPNPY
jgi:probable rRNA maturation factor